MNMVTNCSVRQKTNRENKAFIRNLGFLLVVVSDMGCSNTGSKAEYRENQGKVVECTVELTDPAVMVTWFAKLDDGSIIRPRIYYNQYHKTLVGGRQVEKISRIFRSFGRDMEAKFRSLHLPNSVEIAAHLLLVRTGRPAAEKKTGDNEVQSQMTEWQLLEISPLDILEDKTIVIPAFEVIKKRDLSEEQQALLKELESKYGQIASAAKRNASKPVKQGDKKPWWKW